MLEDGDVLRMIRRRMGLGDTLGVLPPECGGTGGTDFGDSVADALGNAPMWEYASIDSAPAGASGLTCNSDVDIEPGAFEGSSVERVRMPRYTNGGGTSGQFKNAKALRTVSMPMLERAADYMFMDCESLESVDFAPRKVGSRSFYGCKKLKAIDLSRCESIADQGFSGCKSLSGTVDLTACGNGIGLGAFDGSGAETLILSADGTRWDSAPFSGMDSLRKVVFRNAVATSMLASTGTPPFDGCASVEHVVFEGGIAASDANPKGFGFENVKAVEVYGRSDSNAPVSYKIKTKRGFASHVWVDGTVESQPADREPFYAESGGTVEVYTPHASQPAGWKALPVKKGSGATVNVHWGATFEQFEQAAGI